MQQLTRGMQGKKKSGERNPVHLWNHRKKGASLCISLCYVITFLFICCAEIYGEAAERLPKRK